MDCQECVKKIESKQHHWHYDEVTGQNHFTCPACGTSMFLKRGGDMILDAKCSTCESPVGILQIELDADALKKALKQAEDIINNR